MTEFLVTERPLSTRLPVSPFVGLVPYREEDADFFFGREPEKEIVTGNLRAARLTILYGPSGVGKTSLLNAGVVHDLREQIRADADGRRSPFGVCVFRDWHDDPLPAFAEAIRASATEALGGVELPPMRPDETLAKALGRWTKRVQPLLLILDQFEEYFLYHPDEGGEGTFAVALARILNEPNLRANVLLSIREDSWAKLDRFEGRIPGLFANYVRVEQLTRDAARQAIEGPVACWNARLPTSDEPYEIEPALVDAVLAAVSRPLALEGAVEAEGAEVPSSETVEPPFLQLVMDRLWRATIDTGSHELTLARLNDLGGARRIVENHLLDALGTLTAAEQAVASDVFKFLVTRSKTKIAQSAANLALFTNRAELEVTAVLEKLCRRESGWILKALVPPVGRGGERSYELFHDVLAEPVLTWRRDFEARAAIERERRRHRRVAAIAVGALLVAAAMAILAIWAVAQRNEASTQRQAAQSQAELALGQKRLAQQQKGVALAQTQKANRARHAAQVSELKAKESAAKARASEAKAKASERQAKQSQAKAEASEQQAKESAAEAKASEANAKVSEQRAKASESKARQNAAEAQKSKRFAVRQQHLAVQQAVRARKAARRARVGELLATSAAKLGTDPVQSVRSALTAAALEATNRVEDVLRDALVALRTRGILDGGGGAVKAAVFSRDGSLVATGALGGEVRLFATRTHKLLRVLKVRSPISHVVFSPEGKTLAAGTRDSRALLYDARTGRPQRTLRTSGQVLDLVFAGAGRYLVTASPRNVLQVWDTATGRLVHAASAPEAPRADSVPATSRRLAVSPDGSLVADVLPADPVVRVYGVGSGALVASLEQPGEATDAGFSPNGSYLITTGRRNAFVWDTHTWTQLHVLAGHEAPITDLAFAPDGRVVTASTDSSARVWDPATGTSLFTLVAAHQQKVLAVAVSHNGREVATSSADTTARIWKSPLGAIPVVLAGHTDAVTGVSFSPDDKLVLTASADGFARLWSAADPALRPLGEHKGAVSSVLYSPDGRLVLSGGADSAARIWSARGGLLQALAQGGKVTRAAFVSRGEEVLTAGDDGTAKLWRVSDGALLSTFPHGAPVRAALVVPGGDVVTAGDDGTVKLWTHAAKLVWSRTHGSPIAAAVASTDGVVATGAADGTVRFWRARDGAALHVVRGHAGAITSLAFSRDGTLLASGSADKTARLWDVATGKPLHRLAAHVYGVTSVAFSPDGRSVLTASVDGDARVWSVETGTTVRLLRFHVSTVSQASFSPNGRWVVTAGPTTAGIWQVRTGRLIYFLGGADGNLTSAAFAPDSQRIVTGDTGGGVHTFDCKVCVDLPSLEAQAKARLSALR